MPISFLLYFFSLITLFLQGYTQETQPIVLTTKRIHFDSFPQGFNPSLLKIENGYLLSFREVPNPYYEDWISYICMVVLNDQFEPISQPQRLHTRELGSATPSQSEDARLFSYKGKIYLIYNDNLHVTRPYHARREMFLAELLYSDGLFSLSSPMQLFYEDRRSTLCQKNWTPFEWNEMLLLGYSIDPHEVVFANLDNGECYFGYTTTSSPKWDLGPLRGGTPAGLDGDEYLAFFHSGTVTTSAASNDQYLWHYFMGAYTFSKDPPFQITSLSREPIIAEGFYTHSSAMKRVIYPSGYVADGPYIYLAYGKDDQEIWIATIDREALKASLIPLVTSP